MATKVTQAVKAWHQKQRDAGLKELRLWAHPDDHAAIKRKAESLAKARSKK